MLARDMTGAACVAVPLPLRAEFTRNSSRASAIYNHTRTTTFKNRAHTERGVLIGKVDGFWALIQNGVNGFTPIKSVGKTNEISRYLNTGPVVDDIRQYVCGCVRSVINNYR